MMSFRGTYPLRLRGSTVQVSFKRGSTIHISYIGVNNFAAFTDLLATSKF